MNKSGYLTEEALEMALSSVRSMQNLKGCSSQSDRLIKERLAKTEE